MERPADILQIKDTEAVRQTKFAMSLSLGTGVLMLLLKSYAAHITGSAAILSDAAESVVHILAVGFAAFSLWLSLKPADRTHLYGHDRISFFSSGFEGAMIGLAAFYIMYEAITRWLAGLSVERLTEGLWLIIISTVVNGFLGFYLVRQGKRYHSIVLEANGKHVLTDSWTSLGVIVALILTGLTGWLPFDPILAILVALNILWSGFKLVRRSVGGLMDETDLKTDTLLHDILIRETQKYKIQFHHLRHRNAGNKLLIEFHLLFPDHVTIAVAHEQATRIEEEVHKAFPYETEILSHLEPVEEHDAVHEKVLNSVGNKQNL